MIITRELSLKAVLLGACSVPPVGESLSSLGYGDLCWANDRASPEERQELAGGLPLWALSGYGNGDGYGYGDGDGYGDGYGYGYGDGNGDGDGYGDGYGYGDGDGDGDGYGDGNGYGDGDGNGDGYGDGYGDGNGTIQQLFKEYGVE
jgi:hypothetical protein